MEELIIVKLGGSLITDKRRPYTENMPIIRQICREIKEVKDNSGVRILLGHGGGSYPHTPAVKYQTIKGDIHEDSTKGFCIVQDSASRLNRIVVSQLIECGVNAMSIQPSACAIADKRRIRDMFLKPILKCIEKGIIPVLYGDVMFDGSQGYAIASTEELISYLSIHFLETGRFNLRRILLFGNYDGVYDSNKKVIKEINKENFDEVATCLSDSDEIDATGGMKQKVESMFELAKKGVTVEILNGAVKGNIKNSLLGKSGLGTRISYP